MNSDNITNNRKNDKKRLRKKNQPSKKLSGSPQASPEKTSKLESASSAHAMTGASKRKRIKSEKYSEAATSSEYAEQEYLQSSSNASFAKRQRKAISGNLKPFTKQILSTKVQVTSQENLFFRLVQPPSGSWMTSAKKLSSPGS